MVLTWPAGWIKTAHSNAVSKTRNDPGTIDRFFKTMGIVKLAGIAPPVEIALGDLTGKTIRVSDFKGKIVLLNFWTTWCPDCRYEMPSMEKLYRHFKDREFVMLAINLQEPAERVKSFYEKYKLSFTTLLDTNGQIGYRFGIRSIPTTFILNQKGGLIGKALGPREWDSEPALAMFEHLIQNKIVR
jgi:peroxiredoxin